jgi:hypothetical protein
MTTPVESMLRDGLRELADVPGPRSLVEEALVRAARMRRRRIVLGSAGVVVVAATIAVTIAGHGFGKVPIGVGSNDSTCKTVTDESDPPHGVPRAEWPGFVSVTVAAMPPRDDYTLQSGYGVCPAGGRGTAYAVINLGPNREHGHVTINLDHVTVGSCARLPDNSGTVLFCTEGTATTPLVFGVDEGGGTTVVKAVYPDGRAVSMESNQTTLTTEDLTRVATNQELVHLLR